MKTHKKEKTEAKMILNDFLTGKFYSHCLFSNGWPQFFVAFANFSFLFAFFFVTVACKKSSKLKPANNIQMHQMELNKEVETVFRFLPLSRTFI